jgi:tRNA(fMet)-specific endonuclease VapC
MVAEYILDTDHITLVYHSLPILVQQIDAVGINRIAITSITVEESIRGWLSEVGKASQVSQSQSQAKRLSIAYQNLCDVVQFLSQFQMVNFTEEAHDRFIDLRRQGIRIGTQDLRIAAICLVNQLTLVTRNRQDFTQVPGLVLQDWTQ